MICVTHLVVSVTLDRTSFSSGGTGSALSDVRETCFKGPSLRQLAILLTAVAAYL